MPAVPQAGKHFFPACFILSEAMPDSRKLIVGLGNPGPRYERTRHNAGFTALDYFAGTRMLTIGSAGMGGLYCACRLDGRPVILLKPQTFMNRSGECVALFVRYFDIAPQNMFVIHDDLDLAPGRLKIVPGGGAGGHNGIRSLISHLGTGDFARLKIGIGHPRDMAETAAMPVERYVLSRIPEDQWRTLEQNLTLVAEGILLFIGTGVEAAMNRVNRKESAPD